MALTQGFIMNIIQSAGMEGADGTGWGGSFSDGRRFAYFSTSAGPAVPVRDRFVYFSMPLPGQPKLPMATWTKLAKIVLKCRASMGYQIDDAAAFNDIVVIGQIDQQQVDSWVAQGRRVRQLADPALSEAVNQLEVLLTT